MNSLKKKHILNVFKYTWPLYIFSAVLSIIGLNIIFGVVHKTPDYKNFTLFVSGDVEDTAKLEKDMIEKYKEKDLKSFTCYASPIESSTYDMMFSIPGQNSADLLIVTKEKMENYDIESFCLAIDDELKNEYFPNYSFYEKAGNDYGIKVNKEVTKEYMTLPEEDCYMILSMRSANLGKYSKKPNEEHNITLTLARDWGM